MNKKFLLACSLPFAALAIQWLAWTWLTPFVWFMFFPTVFLSARVDGLRGGIVGTLISICLVWMFFLLPDQRGEMYALPRLFSTMLFMVVGFTLSEGYERLRRAQREILRLKDGLLAANRQRNDIYEHIFATSGNMLGFIDTEHRYVIANPAYAELCGVAPGQMTGKKVADIIGDENYERIVPKLNRALGGEVVQFTATPTLADGRVHTMEAEYRPFSLNGSIIGIVVSLRDITALKSSEAALAASEERLRLTFDATHDGVWDWDLRTGLGYLSPHYYAITGYRPEDVRPDLSFLYRTVHPEDLNIVKANMESGHKHELSEFDYRVIALTGDIKWVRARGRCVKFDEHGVPLRMVGTITDITAQMATLETLRQQREELADRNEEMERFNRVSVGRELDMIALKRQINDLSARLGKARPYSLEFVDNHHSKTS